MTLRPSRSWSPPILTDMHGRGSAAPLEISVSFARMCCRAGPAGRPRTSPGAMSCDCSTTLWTGARQSKRTGRSPSCAAAYQNRRSAGIPLMRSITGAASSASFASRPAHRKPRSHRLIGLSARPSGPTRCCRAMRLGSRNAPQRSRAPASGAASGGVAGGGYACGNGLEGVLPVDLYLPGCPPNPAATIAALLMFLDRAPQRVRGGRLAD